jgi:hypothetical protein
MQHYDIYTSESPENPVFHVQAKGSGKKEKYRTVFQTVVLDANGSVKSILPTSDNRVVAYVQPLDNDIVLASTKAQAQASSNTTPGPSGASVNVEGTATSVSAGTVVATASLTAGRYLVNWLLELTGGTPATADTNNMGLYLGGVLVMGGVIRGTSSDQNQTDVSVEVPSAGSALTIQAIGNGTSAVTYVGQFSAVPSLPVQAQYPSGALIPVANNAPYTVTHSDTVWAAATTTVVPSRVSITAVYCDD